MTSIAAPSARSKSRWNGLAFNDFRADFVVRPDRALTAEIPNGSFEQFATDGAESVMNEKNWTIEANPSVSSQTVSFWKGVGNGLQYTTVPYDGRVVCHIRGACTLSQQLPKLAKGRYRFRFAGNTRSNAKYDKNGIRVTLNDASGNEKTVLPSVPKDLRLTVAEGAKLNLDFNGKITTRTLKLGGQGCIGTVSAKTHPGYITGDGEIEVEPHGMMLLIR